MYAAVEHPTFFGPSETPLFGVLHLPADGRIREAVLICGSLGKEDLDSTRMRRIIATDLASHGFAVLRFDYLGAGDSAHRQGRPDAAQAWADSVGHALEYLRSQGMDSVGLIAHRAGCLITAGAADQFVRTCLIDPPVDGRRYLREQTALFKVSVGEDAADNDTISIAGAVIHRGAATEFGALRPDPHLATTQPGLVVLPAERYDPGLRIRAVAAGRDLIVADRLRPRLILPLPLAVGNDIVRWFHRHAPRTRTVVTPQIHSSTMIPTDDGGCVRETIEAIGPAELFAIRTSPVDAAPDETVTLFFGTSVDRHLGPSREWVELSRQLAQRGGQALRWDRPSVGDSGPVVRDQWLRIHRQSEIRDALAAARHASPDPAKLRVVGVCSGAWYAAQVAASGAASALVMANAWMWNWRASAAWVTEILSSRRLMAGGDVVIAGGPSTPTGEPGLVGNVLRARTELRHAYRQRAPRTMRRASTAAGVTLYPDSVLALLARRGVHTTVILCPTDAELFEQLGGVESIQRLQGSAAPPTLVTLDRGDHSAYHQSVRRAIRGAVGVQQPSADAFASAAY